MSNDYGDNAPNGRRIWAKGILQNVVPRYITVEHERVGPTSLVVEVGLHNRMSI